MPLTPPHFTAAQRGAASLTVAATLLLLSSLVALYAHRGMWFEQKASRNQVQAIEAAELAQAGLDWATAQLNNPVLLAAAPSCEAAAVHMQGQTFRERYANPQPAVGTTPSGFFPPASASAGCTLASSGELVCACPAPGEPITLNAPSAGRFVVQLQAVSNPPTAIEVHAAGQTAGNQGRAEARQVLLHSPAIVHPPAAALSAGGRVNTQGRLRVQHTDTAVSGAAVRAGASIDTGADTELAGGAGVDASPAAIADDPVLAQLRQTDGTGQRFIEVMLGRTQATFLSDPLTTRIDADTCNNPAACGALLLQLAAQGRQQFWLGTDTTLDTAGTAAPPPLGTAERPVLLLSASPLTLSGPLDLHGMLLVGHLHVGDMGGGTATLIGAVAIRDDLTMTNGDLHIRFHRPALGMAGGIPTGLLVPVPGSWRDRHAPY